MFLRRIVAAAWLIGVAATGPVTAATLTVQNHGDGADAYALIDPTKGTSLQPGVSIDAAIWTGSLMRVSRSPYDGSATGTPLPGFEGYSYFAVGPHNTTAPSPATLSMTFNALGISLLWGSIDTYNLMQFFHRDVLLGTVDSDDFEPSSNEPFGLGASYVTIMSDTAFDRVVFSSTNPAFEFANIVLTTPGGGNNTGVVPLPMPAVLLLSGFGALTFLRRRGA